MNKTVKYGLAALALATVSPVFAQETQESETVGWTPIAIGIATPVQLPWGMNMWDVFGLDLNLFYSDAPLMYGLDIGGIAALTRGDMMGLQVAGLGNVALADVYGVRGTIGVNYAWDGEVYGADLGMVGITRKFAGLNAEFLGSYHEEFCGLEAGLLGNIVRGEATGAQLAGLANYADKASGLQFAFIFNMTEVLNGAQVSLVNYARECPAGFQIGLINIIIDNKIKVLPFVNGYF